MARSDKKSRPRNERLGRDEKEEILAWFPYLIDKLLPGTLMQWREKRASVEKELLIQHRLEALDKMYKEAVK